MIAIDTETTGVDFAHGARPFFVTICRDTGEVLHWEWDVDPRTREVRPPAGDLAEIKEEVLGADRVVGQNLKFDLGALTTFFPDLDRWWPYDRTEDTLMAGHLLDSSSPHDLTSMALHYLGVDIEPFEVALGEATKAARRAVQQARLAVRRGKEDRPFADWRIAEEGLEDMPSTKGGKGKESRGAASDSPWRCDTWLPRAMLRVLKGIAEGDEAEGEKERYRGWDTSLTDYANADSGATLALWGVMERLLRQRHLWSLYEFRRKLIPVVYRMERRGITWSEERCEALTEEFGAESERAGRKCVHIASGLGHELVLPRTGNNRSLTSFCFDPTGLDLPTIKTTDNGNPSLDKYAMEAYELTLPDRSSAKQFITALRVKRSRDTQLTYLASYSRFGVRVAGRPGWRRIFPTLNPTGTAHLRFSSSNPNEQNVSKRGIGSRCAACDGAGKVRSRSRPFPPEKCGACKGEGEVVRNLRYVFGPAPDREWWSLDAKNIELRIPAYESGEEAFIALFEQPDDPPYFGSNHLLVASILYPREFAACVNEHGQVDGRIFKKKYADTLYQWVKNGNFAVQYGAVDRSDGTGTADLAYHLPGAHSRIKARFAKQEALNQKWVRYADKHGYVETMPDRTVDPRRGYPVRCTRTEWGRVLPTVPLNYHVSGTAMWWMCKAMVRCEEYLGGLNRRLKLRDGRGYYLIMQVHDEMTFDFPRGRGDKPWETNLEIVKEVQRLMETGGDDIGVPTPVSCEYHAENWSEGLSL